MAASAPPLIGTARDWAVDLTVATVAGLFLGLAGPFGSYLNGPPQVRVAYWVGCLWIGAVVFGVGIRLVLWLGDRARSPRWFSLAAGALLVTVPLALAVALIAGRLWPFLRSSSPLDWYGQCLVVAAPLVLAQAALRPSLRRPGMEPAVVALAPAPLAAAIGGESLLCLQMEDHYVRVHRADGSRLVHATFGQAMAALSQVEGLQVHRSWWVARHAVAGAVTEGRKIRLILVNRLSVPVSRASVAKLKAAGWLGFSAL